MLLQSRFLSFSQPWFHMLSLVSLSRWFTDHFLLFVVGFYGQLQTFCPPHYADTQKNVQHGVSCNMVPPFEDCLVPTSAGQAGLGIFHRTFSAHSGITGKCQLGTLWMVVYSLWALTDLLKLWMWLGPVMTDLTLHKEEMVFRPLWSGWHWDPVTMGHSNIWPACRLHTVEGFSRF